MATTGFTCIDLFCGAGGLSQGFYNQGFDVRIANDFDAYSAMTYRAAHPDANFIEGPIEHLESKMLLELAGLKKGELDCLIGGPPCQAFSVYNHQRGFHDARSGLFREYLRLVEGLLPRFVVMENVTGILSAGGGRAVEEIHARLTELGYAVSQDTLKAEQYGVPQERRRVFFVGTRLPGPYFSFPEPAHGAGGKPYVTVRDAISDLPALNILEGKEVSEYTGEPSSAYQSEMRHHSDALFNHVAPRLAPINMERLKHIPQGGSWRDIPVHLLPSGMRKARRCDHTKRYGRLHPDGLACTILTKCDLHWGAYIHPEQQRTLTVREAARFQSFPDRMRFFGPRIEQFRQVGNAVPPLLAEAVASSIKELLIGAQTERENQCLKSILAT
ncbi:MAG: DNA cytosine methyltransferase [Candidatus Hydrogenedentes bacterium]|nr:DNA cytosine methyltransferase [Candidatus Hydrogenedentota bacterium]